MLELSPLGLLLFSGIGTITLNRLWIGKVGAIFSLLSFIMLSFWEQKITKVNWFHFLNFEFNFSFNFGQIEILLCLIINIILLCLYYTISTICFEKDVYRKFGILNVFIFFMCLAILSNNLIQFYVAIEALGLISAFLVSIEKGAETEATKVFIFNKFASILFLIGTTLLVIETNSFDISEICKKNISLLSACLFLFACCCKGAQMPFSYWLIDAVKANIFASILIHAGTIIAIGIIFIAKFSFIFEQFLILKQSMYVVGMATSIYMGFCALAHNNIKKIVACLTASSAGIMFIACGLGEYSVAVLYLICHAFFKSMLFLAFAYLISAMSGEKNINRMGGIARIAPKVTSIVWISFLFASGFPLLTGFFPKIALSGIIQNTDSNIFLVATILANLLNIMAIFRMLFQSIYGDTKADEMTFFRASKSNEYTFIPFWSLATISMLFSFVVWKIFKVGLLGFGDEEMTYISENYLQDSLNILLQIILAMSSIAIFEKSINNRIGEKIALLIRKHKLYKRTVRAIVNTVMRSAGIFDAWCHQIAHAGNVETFKELYNAGNFLKTAHINCLQNHIVWMLFGMTLCLIFIITEGVLG